MIGTRPARRRIGRTAAATLVAVALAAGAACSSSGESAGDGDNASGGGGGGTPTDIFVPEGASISGPPDGTNPQPGGSLVMAIEAEPEGLDPTRYAFAGSGHFVASAVFDPLATIDDHGDAVPYLAEAIEGDESGKVWTITVRDGVTFHDGTPVDAEAIVDNLEAHRQSIITGAALQTVTEVSSPTPNTVQIDLSLPWFAFPAVLTSQLGYVAQPEDLAANTISAQPVGSGPFMFDKHTNNESWDFQRYDDYWRTAANGDQLPYLAEIQYRPIPDDAARLTALEDGDADMINTFRPEQVLTLRDSDYKVVEYTTGEEEFLQLNTTKPPFDNVTARRALAYATDAAGWIDELNSGVGSLANGPFAPGQLGYLADNGYPAFDMAKAKELVAQYEAETGAEFAFTYLTVDDPTNLRNHQYLANLYEEAGMDVTVQGMAQINLIAQSATGNYQVSAFRNFGFPDPDTDAVFWEPNSIRESGASLNFPRFDDPVVQEAIEEARASTNDEDRDAAYQKVSAAFGQEVPYIWLTRANWVLAANPRVNGMYRAVDGSIQTLGAKTWIAELWVT